MGGKEKQIQIEALTFTFCNHIIIMHALEGIYNFFLVITVIKDSEFK